MNTTVSFVLGLRSSSRSALQERIELLALALPLVDIIEVDVEGARSLIHQATEGATAYLLDVNRATVMAALKLHQKGLPYIVDTGDDPKALALAMGLPRIVAGSRGVANTSMLRWANLIVCRGWYHQKWLEARMRQPVYWVPDTAPDWIYDSDLPPGNPQTVATFGTMQLPRAGHQVYGWEVVELVAASKDLRGIIIGRGPGLDLLRLQAERQGSTERIEFFEAAPMRELIETISRARFVTSIQSNDKAGWFRTTGKLPLALASRRVVIATAVGEAARILPSELTLRPARRQALVDGIRHVISTGGPEGWDVTAAHLSEIYRRSTVADHLATFVKQASNEGIL